jgi:DNA segregation ATPase FtsK/SpoIIIE, S-DNA-T family
MAKKRNTDKSQLSLKMRINDERIPKLIGILCLFLALYLVIAFTSYLFTWQIDQDRVLRHSWGLLLKGDVEMANWLGRLGAIISNMFIYWGFGLSSFIFIPVLTYIGLGRIKRVPFKEHVPMLWKGFWILLGSSILLAFIFQGAEFNWGGEFGKNVCSWLINFVGAIGLTILILFVGVGLAIWSFNPNFNELTFTGMINEVKYYFDNLINGRAKVVRKPKTLEEHQPTPTTGLRPREASDRNVVSDTFEVVTDTPGAPSSDTSTSPDKDNDSVEKTHNPLKEGQLSFNLDKEKRAKKEAIKPGESTLEIAAKEEDLIANGENSLLPDTQIAAGNVNHSEPYDPTLELSSYENPVLALLEDYNEEKVEIDRAELERNKDQIIETLLNYKIEIVKIKATIGPTVTLYEIVPAPGVRISRIKNLEDDIALSLAALGIRIIAPIPGKGTIGIEVPNQNKQIVSLKEVLMNDKFKRAQMDLPIGLGKTISNEVFVADLAKMPHLLIAGATGQGKSVGINVILMSLLYKKHPSQIKFVLIDPKKVELFPYARIENHFLAYLPGLDEPIVTDTTKVVHTLNSLIIEMETRYDLLKKAQARNIREYNNKFVARRLNPNNGHKFMPFIVLVIDEFADLIMTAGKEIELPIGRLAQLSRAVGIHLIIATQRPSVNIITGVIKANFPARIAFKVTAKVDSRTILDTGGADRLIGRGDMLLSFGSDIIRLQCAFVDTPEVEKVLDYIHNQPGYPTPYFLPEFHGDDDGPSSGGQLKMSDLDEMFHDAARLVVQNQHGSTSMIQRRLKLGYNRAGRIMDQLESLGVVGPSEGSKAREVLVYDEVELERYLEDLKNRK